MVGLAEAAPTLTAPGAEALTVLPALILSLSGAAVLALDLILDRTRRRRGEPDARTPAMIGGGFEADPLLFTSLLGLASAAAFLGAATVSGDGVPRFRDAIVADGLAAGSGILILLLTAAVLVAVTDRTGHKPSQERGERRRGGEFFCLVLLGSAFLVLCVQSVGLATVFVSVEALSLIVFVLTSLEHEQQPHGHRRPGILRTFIVSESASAGLLLGLVFVHGATGATSLAALTAAATAPAAGSTGGHDTPLLALGATLILAALVTKTLALPFGFPTRARTTDRVSLVAVQASRSVQIAITVLLLRAGLSLEQALGTGLLAGFLSVAAAVLLVLGVWLVARRGLMPLPLAAMVHHLGFLLMAVVVELAGARTGASTLPGGVPILFYLFVFEVPRLGAVTWTVRRGPQDSRAAPGFTVLLLSLGGMPPLPGFWGRLILFREAMATGCGLLAFIAAATTVAGLYYYLSHAVDILREARGERGTGLIVPAIVTVIAVACLVVGVFPETLLALCRAWAG